MLQPFERDERQWASLPGVEEQPVEVPRSQHSVGDGVQIGWVFSPLIRSPGALTAATRAGIEAGAGVVAEQEVPQRTAQTGSS